MAKWSITATGRNIQYKYNDSGIRTSKTVNGTTTNYYLDGDKVIYEVTGNNKIYYTYDTDDNLIGFKYNNDQYYYVRNGQGDIIGILDNSLNNVISYTYDTWGKLLSIRNASGQDITNDTTSIGYINQYRYRGYRYDNETSMYYLNSRYYNLDLCRFINFDDTDNLTENLKGLTDKNLFAYCDNNPVMRIDDGGDFWANIIIGASIGAAVSIVTQLSSGTSISNIDWRDVVGSAVSGAIASIPGLGIIGTTLLGGVANVIGGYVGGSVKSGKDVIKSFASGAISAGIGEGTSWKVCKNAEKNFKKLSRAQRKRTLSKYIKIPIKREMLILR